MIDIQDKNAKQQPSDRFREFLFHIRRLFSLSRTVWTYGLDDQVHIRPTVAWPLWLIPILLTSHFVAPGGVWLALAIALILVFGASYAWVRLQVQSLRFRCDLPGGLVMVGDEIAVNCCVTNDASLPVIWCEFIDSADPRFRFAANRVLGCASNSSTEWNETVTCQRRGWLRVGPVH